MIDEKPDGREGQGHPLRPGPGHIRVEGVTFAYQPETGPVLNNVTLDIAAGQTTALVGGSGSGKSTLLSLMLRFWEPAAGQISIDGQPLPTIEPASLRAGIAYVGQDTFLFDGSVRDNIAIGRDGASDAEIRAAAQAAAGRHIHRKPAAGL